MNRWQAQRPPLDDSFGRGLDRNMSLMTIANHVILSVAKNLPSSGLDVQRELSPTRMRGGMVALAPPQPNRAGADVPPVGRSE